MFLVQIGIFGQLIAFLFENRHKCWENEFAKQILSIIILDFIVLLFDLLIMAFYWFFVNKFYPKHEISFNVSFYTMNAIFSQLLLWCGLYFSPYLGIIQIIKLLLIFLIHSYLVKTIYKVSKSGDISFNNESYFLVITLTGFILTIVGLGGLNVLVDSSKTCGPFNEIEYPKPYDYLLRLKSELINIKAIGIIFQIIFSPGLMAFILFLLSVFMYASVTVSRSYKQTIKYLKNSHEDKKKERKMLIKRKNHLIKILDQIEGEEQPKPKMSPVIIVRSKIQAEEIEISHKKMNNFFNSFVKNQRSLIKLSRLSSNRKILNFNNNNFKKYSTVENDDQFGIGSKYTNLDSASGKYQIEYPKKNHRKFSQKIKVKEIEENNDKEDGDTFGTLASELDELELKTSLDYTKSINESKSFKNQKNVFEQDEIEKKYDKVLNHIRLSNENRPNTEQYYANKMNDLVKQDKIKQAIDVFFLEMIEKDRFKPTLYLYKTLMRPLAQQGYTHMVFEIFKKITTSNDDDWSDSKNITKLHKIITLLFQSCANSPWKEYSVRKCDSIRFYLKHRQITPNVKNYSAMILAYGKSGAIYEAFNVVDEMIYNKIKPNSDIINNLLCACISQPNYGFRYGLMAWQMAIKLRIKPDLTMYNLILKAANDCSISLKKDRINLKLPLRNEKAFPKNESKNLFPKNSEEFKQFSDEDLKFLNESTQLNNELNHENINEKISQLTKDTTQKINDNIEVLNNENSNDDVLVVKKEDVHVIDDLNVVGKSLESQIQKLEWWQDIKSNIDKSELLKGLSDLKPELKELILAQNYESLLTQINHNLDKEVFDYITNDLDCPEGHLHMLGGLDGFLKSMIYHRVKPDYKTINSIIQLTPNNLESEKELLDCMKKYNIEQNVDFINILIKRRITRNDPMGADEAFKMIQENKLSPNIMTFGCLAYKINSLNLLIQFLSDLNEMNLKLNPIIISTLYSKGRHRKDLKYLSYLFNFILENNIKIDHKLADKIRLDFDSMKKELIRIEKIGKLSDQETVYYNKLRRFYSSFKSVFDEWIEKVKFERQVHPYAKFARKDDKLYESFVAKTQRFQKTEKQ
ncbi:unnamed protein product [Brachionus calyciflorus]|uniref:TMC domain-containing protein n=1 Tax=Brachionus calyciflorus TaxID=104777 RepID=A0A813R1D6_9BILA|nr:unnamed protein product [Brachionus calyciflorus]